MFIQRDYNRTEHDDFELNVRRYIPAGECASPQYINGVICGWLIKPLSEWTEHKNGITGSYSCQCGYRLWTLKITMWKDFTFFGLKEFANIFTCIWKQKIADIYLKQCTIFTLRDL